MGVDRGATELEGVAAHIQTQRLSNVVFGPEVGIGLQPFNGLGIRPGRFAISQNLTAVAHHPGIDGRPPVPGGVGETPIHGVAIGILLQFGDLLAVGDQIFPRPGITGQISAGLLEECLVVIHGDNIEARGQEVDFVINRSQAEHGREDIGEIDIGIAFGQRFQVERNIVLGKRHGKEVGAKEDIGQRTGGGLGIDQFG